MPNEAAVRCVIKQGVIKSVDVASLKKISKRFYPPLAAALVHQKSKTKLKKQGHRMRGGVAVFPEDDVFESIER